MSVSYIRGTRLTHREKEITELITSGNTTRQIAEMLAISAFTVANHRKNILKKKGLKNMRDLIA